MSGTFPLTPKFRSLRVASVQPTLRSRTVSGRRQARQIAGQYWRMVATFPPMSREDFSPILAFIISQRGAFDTFILQPTVHKDTQGNPGGSPKVKLGSQTGRTVNTDGWTANQIVMKAGDFVKFSGHAKVYMLTGDVTSDGNGDASMSIEPALIASPAVNEDVGYNNVPFTVALSGGLQEFSATAGDIYSYEVSFEEVL